MNSDFNRAFYNLTDVLQSVPDAAAVLHGDSRHPDLHGILLFFSTMQGVLAAVQIKGLPESADPCKQPIFGFHIHSGESCSGNPEDTFADAGMHLNTHDCPHPFHAGDLPPLFGADGNALSVFLTNRFNLKEILGKTVIIHSKADDFTSQPAGNSGTKIACGKILPVKN